MPEEIVLQPATDIRRDDIVDAFNAAYAEYFVPIQFTGATFNATVIRESINLGGSVVVLHAGKAVGLGLLGVRGDYGWIGAVGVIPEYRRRGIARRIMNALVDRARELALKRLQLEVITKNEGAYQLYRDLGFETQRRLLILTRNPRAEKPALHSDGFFISREDGHRVMPHVIELQDIPRNWQRQAQSLEPALDLAEGLVLRREAEGDPQGAILFSTRVSQVNMADFVCRDRSDGEILLADLINRFPSAHVSYSNVGENEATVPILQDAGFIETLAQYEMYLSLA